MLMKIESSCRQWFRKLLKGLWRYIRKSFLELFETINKPARATPADNNVKGDVKASYVAWLTKGKQSSLVTTNKKGL